MKKLKELSPKASTILTLIALVVLIPLSSALTHFFEELERESVEEIEQVKREVKLTLKSEEYSLNDPETPYHYIVQYEIKENSSLVSGEDIYVYEFKYASNKKNGLKTIASDKHTYKKLQVQGKEFYASSDKMPQIKDIKVVGEGLTYKDIREKHPVSIIFGKNLPNDGNFVIRNEEKIPYDIIEEVYIDLLLGYPSKNDGGMWNWSDY